jgi:glycosyltransferase involved in cell wall biosynthesis
MSDSRPLISIGLPVFNGEDYIRQALDSLLAQSYVDFEVNISDNASTDRTEEVCGLYSAKDKRVRYHRNPQNLGILPNWRRVLELASGDYFMWAAHDDHWSENYLQTLLQCLLANPKAILAAGKTVYVDESGGTRSDMDPDFAPSRSTDGNIGVVRQLLLQHAHNWLHGLYPANAVVGLSNTFFAEDAWGSDMLFLLELCLSRQVVGSDEAVIYKRVRPVGSNHPRAPNKTPKELVKWQCWFAQALMRVILRSPLSTRERVEVTKIYLAYLRWLYLRKGLYSYAKLWLRAGYQDFRERSLAYKKTS